MYYYPRVVNRDLATLPKSPEAATEFGKGGAFTDGMTINGRQIPNRIFTGTSNSTREAIRAMNICSPSEFEARWPGSLQPVAFPPSLPSLPGDCRNLLTEFGLPRKIKIYCYNDITLRSSGSATPLDAIWQRDLKRGKKLGAMPSQWSRFWHLADQEYIQGGGWICLEENTGRLFVIDLDLPDPMYLLNSSVPNFYKTLAHFLDWSETTDGRTAETIRLRDALRCQDCIPAAELEPFWMNFIAATLDSDAMRLAVSLVANNA